MFVQNGLGVDRNITYGKGRFLGATKLVNQVSLNGHCGRKNENHQTICTYFSSAKAEDSGLTDFKAKK